MFSDNRSVFRLLTGSILFAGLLAFFCWYSPCSHAMSVEEEAAYIVSQMTLEEKIGVLVGDGRYVPDFEKNTNDAGQGMIIEDMRSQVIIPRLPRLRTTAMSDGPAGLNREAKKDGEENFEYTTAFPTGTCLAASWNMELVKRIGDAFGNEVREYGYELILAPGVNLHRNPNDGRVFEYYSEDPLLSGKSAAAMVQGMQQHGIGATLKHFMAHNQQANRHHFNAVISQRALRELYLRSFEIAVREGHPKSIMTSYNRMNGLYTDENVELLQLLTRQEWGFDGFYITDFDGKGSALGKVRAGINLLMSGSPEEFDELLTAVKNQKLDEKLLDERLTKYIEFKLSCPYALGEEISANPDLEAHAALAREAAAEGLVLLKNDNSCLPLEKAERVALFGKTAYSLIPYGTGSGEVRSHKRSLSMHDGMKELGFQLVEGMDKDYLDYVEKIKRENKVPDYFNNPKMRADNGIVGDQAPKHFKGRLVAFSRERVLSREEVEGYAGRSDVAVICFGRSSGENYENGYLPITDIERTLLETVCDVYHSAGKKVVVVLNVSGVWETASWSDLPDAILMAWLPGQEGGGAIADVLSGKANPSGKLPDTIPVKYDDLPSAPYYPGTPKEEPLNSLYNEGIYVGYRYFNTFDVPVAYAFGHGLSYTTFEYSDLKGDKEIFDGSITFSVKVTNTGDRAGKEAVQLYLTAPMDKLEKPEQELKGFAKTQLLKPGESETLQFVLDGRALASYWSGISAWVADAGVYVVSVGASSRDIRQTKTFQVPDGLVVEKTHDILFPDYLLNELSRNRKAF
ncbi:MAG TPA: glycoside hydrolase family 3 C-terminal domain-containing protein [Candidatus Hydrogenedentes bacterium]|jgi:beta-glucosidase|nr:glycoside hydrolase family 3 C-terminal domain-containing protein [Candidatus Hydrogenedentota bacterium]